MKQVLIALVLSLTILISGCASTSQNVIHTANIVATYERMEFQQNKVVQLLIENKGVFTKDEVELLKTNQIIIDQVRAEILMAKDGGEDLLDAVAGGSNIIAQYGLVKSSTLVVIDILEQHMQEFPLTLQYRLKQQISDAKQMDNSVQALLTSEDGISHAQALKSIAQLVGTLSKLIVLL